MEYIETCGDYEVCRDFEILQLRKSDEVIHEENVSDLAYVLFEDVNNDEELDESEEFLKKEISFEIREKGVPANVANAFASWAVWHARISR